jgi:hypothetical protein
VRPGRCRQTSHVVSPATCTSLPGSVRRILFFGAFLPSHSSQSPPIPNAGRLQRQQAADVWADERSRSYAGHGMGGPDLLCCAEAVACSTSGARTRSGYCAANTCSPTVIIERDSGAAPPAALASKQPIQVPRTTTHITAHALHRLCRRCLCASARRRYTQQRRRCLRRCSGGPRGPGVQVFLDARQAYHIRIHVGPSPASQCAQRRGIKPDIPPCRISCGHASVGRTYASSAHFSWNCCGIFFRWQLDPEHVSMWVSAGQVHASHAHRLFFGGMLSLSRSHLDFFGVFFYSNVNRWAEVKHCLPGCHVPPSSALC